MGTLTNLVVATSSFVGREKELALLVRLDDEGERLVSLIGAGGMGKTRLAARYSSERLASFTDNEGGGLWVVDLAEARTLGAALAAIDQALPVSCTDATDEAAMGRSVGLGIRGLGRVLVVLDNAEYVASSLSRVVESWVREATSARFLVTSRKPLGVDAERVILLEGLPCEDAEELFRKRVTRAGAELPGDEPLLEIVEAVDRMPFAIELAATRMRVLSSSEMLERLKHPLKILRGQKTAARHSSVEQAVQVSVELLEAPERTLFALLSVFENGFLLTDVEAVLGSLVDIEVLDGVDELVRTSLLQAQRGARTRYTFFETVREVAFLVDVAADLRRKARRAHMLHFARVLREGEFQASQLGNCLRAHAFALKEEDEAALDAVFELAVGLGAALAERGLSRQRLRVFDETLSLPSAEWRTSPHARLTLGRGRAFRDLGEIDKARSDFLSAKELAEADECIDVVSQSLVCLGELQDVAGDTRTARSTLRDGLALLAQTKAGKARSAHEAAAMLVLGHGYRREGQLVEAQVQIEGAIQRFRSLKDEGQLAAALYELAVVELFARRASAAATLDEGLRTATRAGARVMEGTLRVARGGLFQEKGSLPAALADYAHGARVFGELGARYREASALYYLATAYAEGGDTVEALGVLIQATERIRSVGSPRYETLIAGAMASALALGGEVARALEALRRGEAALRNVRSEPALEAAFHVHGLIVAVAAERRVLDDAIDEAKPLVAKSSNDDSRYALRLLEGMRTQLGPRVEETLRVWSGSSAFQVPGGVRVSLPEASPLRLILERLCEVRLSSPGSPISIDEVISAGWPNEKMRSDAARNRAYVALTSLRKKGLRDVLVSAKGGYSLSQGVVVRRVEGDTP